VSFAHGVYSASSKMPPNGIRGVPLIVSFSGRKLMK